MLSGVRYFYMRRCINISELNVQVNEQIRDKEVRVIGEDGEQLGIMSAQEAQKLADEAGVDLVKSECCTAGSKDN